MGSEVFVAQTKTWRALVGLAALGAAQLTLGCVAHGGRPLPAPSSTGDGSVALPAPAPHATASSPQFWVNELSTARDRRRALERLVQLFEDARDRSNGDLAAPEVKRFIELTVEPLTRAYVNAFSELSPELRSQLITALAQYHDRRTEPALSKALLEFAQHPEGADTELLSAVSGAADLHLESLATPIFAAFLKLHVSSHGGLPRNLRLTRALLDMPDPAWVDTLCALLEVEMTAPTGQDAAREARFRDQVFWQASAAQLLGRIADARAVRPLLQVMLDPAKVEVQPSARLALAKLGQATVLATSRLLSGQDAELVLYSARLVAGPAPNVTYKAVAAQVLGVSGRRDAAPALVAALGAEQDPSLRALMACELTKLPASRESKLAFKRAYESLSLDAEVPSGESALETLTEAAGEFRDPALVEWLLTRAALAHGSPEDVQAYRARVLMTALELAGPSQLPALKRAFDRYGSELEMTAYRQTEALLQHCAERIACYLAALEQPANQERQAQFIAIKAGYMIGEFGDAAARDELIAVLARLTNAAVRFVAAHSIDHLTPNGSQPVASRLYAIIAGKSDLLDLDSATRNAPLELLAARIEGRR